MKCDKITFITLFICKIYRVEPPVLKVPKVYILLYMNFKYTIDITADPEEVFTALTNPFQIELWSGYPAEMKAEEGFVFSLWEGDICGVNLEVKPNRLLVQEWFFGETDQRSIVTIKLKKDGPRTRVELEHTNIPDEVFEEIVEGWKEYYLGSIKGLLEMY